MTATYFSWHGTNARPTKNIAGKIFPSILKNFLVCVIVKIFLRTNKSDRKPETIKLNHRAIEGKAERNPF